MTRSAAGALHATHVVYLSIRGAIFAISLGRGLDLLFRRRNMRNEAKLEFRVSSFGPIVRLSLCRNDKNALVIYEQNENLILI